VVGPFSFDKHNETDDMSTDEIRDALYEEICFYHPQPDAVQIT
jgi:hypothetical protein